MPSKKEPIEQIIEFAIKNGYCLVLTRDPTLTSFTRGFGENKTRVNVWENKKGFFSVGTCLNHPKQGKTQLFRRCNNIDAVIKIIKNPRVHTDVGYKKKNGAPRRRMD